MKWSAMARWLGGSQTARSLGDPALPGGRNGDGGFRAGRQWDTQTRDRGSAGPSLQILDQVVVPVRCLSAYTQFFWL